MQCQLGATLPPDIEGISREGGLSNPFPVKMDYEFSSETPEVWKSLEHPFKIEVDRWSEGSFVWRVPGPKKVVGPKMKKGRCSE